MLRSADIVENNHYDEAFDVSSTEESISSTEAGYSTENNNLVGEDKSHSNQSSSHMKTNESKHQQGFGKNNYEDLDVPLELSSMFQYIDQYEPKVIGIETEMKCFIPPYIPAVNDVDPFIKIPRPDGKSNGLGLLVLDEPVTEQSDPAILELQLHHQVKKRNRGYRGPTIRSIENADSNPQEIDRWIQSVKELHKHMPKDDLIFEEFVPDLDNLMRPFPEEIISALNNGTVKIPTPSIDLSLDEYTRVLCSLLDIPVGENILHSLYIMFRLNLKFQETQGSL